MVLTFAYNRGALRFYINGIETLEADRHVLANLLSEIGKATSGSSNSDGNGGHDNAPTNES